MQYLQIRNNMNLKKYSKFKNDVDEDLFTFLASFEEFYRKVEGAGESIAENHRCLMLLECLGENLDCLALQFESCPNDKLTFSELK